MAKLPDLSHLPETYVIDRYGKIFEHMRLFTSPTHTEHQLLRIRMGVFIGISFLQDNGLTTRTLVSFPEDIEKLEIKIGDLTEEGLLFYRTIYQKYWKAIDRGTDPEVSKKRILKKALKTFL